jgi:hypothetical protein
VIQHGIEIMLGSPVNKLAVFCDIGDAAVTVLISFAVKPRRRIFMKNFTILWPSNVNLF